MNQNFQQSDYNPLKRIQLQLETLSKTHKKIATYILNNFDQATFSTSAQLSQDCGASESSVIRLATALGYSGYSEFQHAMQDLLKSQLSLSQRLEISANGANSNTAIFHEVMTKGEKSIQKAKLCIDRENFDQAVKLLSEADQVYLFGARSSYALVNFLGLELRWIRSGVHIINGISADIDFLTTLRKDDVLLGISLPRYLRSTTQALQLAYERGIPTIAITDTLSSPLVPYAKYPLLVNSEILSYSDNIVPIACTITALLNAVGVATRPASNGMLTRHEETWDYFDMYMR